LASLPWGNEYFGLIVLIIIGIIIIWIAGILLALLPAFIIAGVVWWLTGNELLAGIGFLIVAIFFFTQRGR
jgi:hypothetical protein